MSSSTAKAAVDTVATNGLGDVPPLVVVLHAGGEVPRDFFGFALFPRWRLEATEVRAAGGHTASSPTDEEVVVVDADGMGSLFLRRGAVQMDNLVASGRLWFPVPIE